MWMCLLNLLDLDCWMYVSVILAHLNCVWHQRLKGMQRHPTLANCDSCVDAAWQLTLYHLQGNIYSIYSIYSIHWISKSCIGAFTRTLIFLRSKWLHCNSLRVGCLGCLGPGPGKSSTWGWNFCCGSPSPKTSPLAIWRVALATRLPCRSSSFCKHPKLNNTMSIKDPSCRTYPLVN